MKRVNATLITSSISGDIICFGGKTFVIGTKNGNKTVDLAPVDADQKVTGSFETYELI